MQPIVNGLEETYNSITVVSINARDGADGETWFDALGLRGHPAILIFDADSNEVYRRFGVIPQDELKEEIDNLIEN